MNAEVTHRLIASLADPGQRGTNVTVLAEQLGAKAVFVFTPDHHAGVLVPAPGFPAAVPPTPCWRALLDRAVTPGTHSADVAFPTVENSAPAVAYAYPGVVYVVVGPHVTDHDLVEQLATTAPLLAATLRAEADTQLAGKAAERAQNEFFAMLGHELRNPLAPIVTALQMLRKEGGSSKLHGVLERQVAHVQQLVDDLLDVSRITGGKIELRKERIEASAIVARALEMSRPLLEQRRSELVAEVADEGLAIDGDPARLAQVIANLLTNAAKYSEPGKRISIQAERTGAMIRIAVTDQGIGIERDFLDRVFENFVQIPQGIDRARGGLGLGLAIVRNLVQLHGGTVRVFSEGRMRGAQFVVELPADNAPRAAAVIPPPRSKSMFSGARVLVVDDNSDAAELLGELLADHGHSVHVAHSGPEALKMLATFTPDAALLDIGLPVMDGYELAVALRGELPSIRLIALTGYGAPNDRVRTREAGFDAHLTKPVSLATVTTTLAELLGS